MSRRLMSSVLIAALVALIGGAPVGYAADPIPIGVSVAQTGPVALAGQEQVLGAQIAEEYFNKKGGVNGRPFKLIFQDAGSDEATAINAYQNLINVAKVVAIIGPSLSQQMFAAGTPLVAMSGPPLMHGTGCWLGRSGSPTRAGSGRSRSARSPWNSVSSRCRCTTMSPTRTRSSTA